MRWSIAALVAIAAAAAAGGWWYYYGPREISVSIFPDYAFRQRPDWRALLDSRIAGISRIYGQAAVHWKIASIETEDRANTRSDSMDARRADMARETRYPGDVLLIVTGLHEGSRAGSVNPFSHAALVVDFMDRSEERNTLTMAHEMAHLFGAWREPGTSTLMAPDPKDSRFSTRTASLIRRLRRYDFKQGIAALQGAWDSRVLHALSDENPGHPANPIAQAHQVMAAALVIDGHYAPAIQHSQEALKMDPKAAGVRMQLALIFMQDTQPEAAAAVLREGIRMKPDDSTLHAALAVTLARRDFEGALNEYATAIRLDARNPSLQEALGSLLVGGLGRIDSAIAAYQAALRLNPDLPCATQGLARAQQFKESAKADAAQKTQQANAARTDATLYYQAGLAEMRSGNIEAGTKALTRASELNPRLAQPHSTLALACYLRGDYTAALSELDKAKNLGAATPKEFAAAIQAKGQ